MNKKILALTALLLLPNHSFALSWQDVVTEYVLPCGAGILVGGLVSETEGNAIGMGVCAGISTLNLSREIAGTKQVTKSDLDAMKRLMKDYNTQVANDLKARMDDKYKDLKSDQARMAKEISNHISDIVGTQVEFITDQMTERLKTAISQPDFIPGLMDKINARVKTEVVNESELRKRQIVREVVEEVISQVTATPIVVKSQKMNTTIVEETDAAPRAKRKSNQNQPSQVNSPRKKVPQDAVDE